MGEPDLLFYDGQCGLCQRSVRFVLARDHRARFRFAPLGGATFAQRVTGAGPLPDSMAILTGDRLLLRSDAVLHILRRLGGAWAVLAAVAAAVPRTWRDGLYDLIARNRHRWFRQGPESCPIPPRAGLDPFLP
jgi:predicted DCC family thiol-disulfide oxidoreductase YuxK